MENDLRHELKTGLKNKSPDDILKAIGYSKPDDKSRERLAKVLGSKTLGLDTGSFDFKYSTSEFLIALSKVAGLNEAEVRRGVRRIEQDISDDRHAFKPYIWVDTHFKRANQPIFALAAMESRRHLGFRDGFWRLPLEQQLAEAQALAREHMAETEGKLVIWGTIQEYWFFYEPRRAYRLAPDGEVLGKHEGPVRNSARMSLR